jgi:hypothetical protein
VEYNLIDMSKEGSVGDIESQAFNSDNYRIFSSLRTGKSEDSMLETLESEENNS